MLALVPTKESLPTLSESRDQNIDPLQLLAHIAHHSTYHLTAILLFIMYWALICTTWGVSYEMSSSFEESYE